MPFLRTEGEKLLRETREGNSKVLQMFRQLPNLLVEVIAWVWALALWREYGTPSPYLPGTDCVFPHSELSV